MGDASHVAAILLLFGVATADAQMTPPPPASGAYQKMTPGNQKVARALFEAQTIPMTPTTTKSGTRSNGSQSTTSEAANGPAPKPLTVDPKPLTLDQIAAMKQHGAGWEHVFRQMRAQGLLADKTIAQVMTRYNQSRPASASVVTTGTGARGGAAVVESTRGGAAVVESTRGGAAVVEGTRETAAVDSTGDANRGAVDFSYGRSGNLR
jgi:hypothetical protein